MTKDRDIIKNTPEIYYYFRYSISWHTDRSDDVPLSTLNTTRQEDSPFSSGKRCLFLGGLDRGIDTLLVNLKTYTIKFFQIILSPKLEIDLKQN